MGIFQSKRKQTCDDSCDKDEQPEMEESVRFAMAQPMLLEMILGYAMRYEDGDLCPANIQKLRLVQKSWKQAVSKKLRQNKEPLFRLKLYKKHSNMRSKFEEKNGKFFDEFVDYWSSGKYGAVPTFRLQLEPEYFRQENYHSFLNCLHKCGVGLVEIGMHVPKNCYMYEFFSNVSLPNLTKLRLTIDFRDYRLANTWENATRGPCNRTLLLESLLTGNKSLKHLVLTNWYWNQLHEFPEAQYVILPRSLTSIQINLRSAENMEILTRNSFPNLQSLTLGISCDASGVSSVYRRSTLLWKILENVRKTLRYLELQGEEYSGAPRQAILLRFPVMEQLKSLEIYGVYFELETKISETEHFFPKLETLVLYEQTVEMLGKWTTDSQCPCTTVKKLALELVDESRPRSTRNTLPLTQEAVQSVHLKFPNVVHLNVEMHGWETSGLHYIFKEMRQLTRLEINVHGAQSFAVSNHWDSLLIGVPFNFVGLLADRPNYFREEFEVELNKNRPSIRMLEELSSFSLTEADVYYDDDEEDLNDDVEDYSENPYISDLAFVYGFLKMPKLIELNFSGRFDASEEMCSEWEKTGRTINFLED